MLSGFQSLTQYDFPICTEELGRGFSQDELEGLDPHGHSAVGMVSLTPPITMFLSSCANTSQNGKVKHSWGTLSLIFTFLLNLNTMNATLIAWSFICQQNYKTKLTPNSEIHGASTLYFTGVRWRILVELTYAGFQHTKSNSSLIKWCNLALHIETITPAGLPPMGKSDVILPDLVISFTVFRFNQFCTTCLIVVWIFL